MMFTAGLLGAVSMHHTRHRCSLPALPQRRAGFQSSHGPWAFYVIYPVLLVFGALVAGESRNRPLADSGDYAIFPNGISVLRGTSCASITSCGVPGVSPAMSLSAFSAAVRPSAYGSCLMVVRLMVSA